MYKNYADVLESYLIPAQEGEKPWWWGKTIFERQKIKKERKAQKEEELKKDAERKNGLSADMSLDELCKELYERYELGKISEQNILIYNTVMNSFNVDSRYDKRTGKMKVYKGIKFGFIYIDNKLIYITIPKNDGTVKKVYL